MFLEEMFIPFQKTKNKKAADQSENSHNFVKNKHIFTHTSDMV